MRTLNLVSVLKSKKRWRSYDPKTVGGRYALAAGKLEIDRDIVSCVTATCVVLGTHSFDI